MRARIPLVLALFLAVSCDQQPTEPLSQDFGAVSTPLASKGVDVIKYDFSFDFNLCGYADVSCEMTAHETYREHQDANGGNHFIFQQNWKGTCFSEATGEEWIIQDKFSQQSQWKDTGQDEFLYLHYVSSGVGKGHAPNFKARWLCKYVMNANGDLVFDRCSQFTCEEFGN